MGPAQRAEVQIQLRDALVRNASPFHVRPKKKKKRKKKADDRDENFHRFTFFFPPPLPSANRFLLSDAHRGLAVFCPNSACASGRCTHAAGGELFNE